MFVIGGFLRVRGRGVREIVVVENRNLSFLENKSKIVGSCRLFIEMCN